MDKNIKTYPHLDTSIQHLADADDVIRVEHILKDLYIAHPQAARIQQVLDHLYRMPRRYRPTSCVLTAPSGAGKTNLLRAFERRYPGYNLPNGAGRRLPVLYLQMQEDPTPKSMYRELLNSAGVPRDTFTRKMPEHECVTRALQALETKIVLIDEVHNMVDWKHEGAMRKWLRMLSNYLRIPIVLAGTDSFCCVFDDFQMSSRWPWIIELPLWTDSPEFQQLLTAWERAYPLRLCSNLNAPEMRKAILEESMGVMDLISKCLSAAAVAAIRLHRECITPDLLKWWRDPPLFDTDDLDPVAVARAWLTDDRVTPEPIRITHARPMIRSSARMAKPLARVS